MAAVSDRLLEGCATPAGTASYAARFGATFDPSAHAPLGSTGLAVSRIRGLTPPRP